MKFAAAILLGLLAVSAAHGKSLNPWEKKAKELEAKFELAVAHKAQVVIEKIEHVVHDAQGHAKDFIEKVKREINATIAAALKEIEILKLDVNLDCLKNASRDIYAAQEAAIVNLEGCKNLSNAYQDIQKIANNASVVYLDVVKDARLIIEGVAECGTEVGVAQLQCVVKYVAQEIKNLNAQWPDAKAFIRVVKVLVSDAERQINTCLNDPTQRSLEEKLQEALNEFSACSEQSADGHFDSLVVY